MYNIELLDNIIDANRIGSAVGAYRKRLYKSYEALEYPVWKRIKVKETEVPDYKPYNNQKVLWHQQEGLSVQPLLTYDGNLFEEKLDRDYGPSPKHRYLVEAFSNTGTVVEVAKGVLVPDPIVIQIELNEENPIALDHHLIHAGVGSEVTVVIDYTGKAGYENGLINIVAEKDAHVHVVKIQNFGKAVTHISSGLSVVDRDANVRFNSIDLGAGLTVTDYSTYLEDENALSNVDSVYLGDGKSRLDLGYNIYHNGRRTVSDVLVKGALLDEARKVFRGNLFFRKGARRSQGSETEYVILLDERVKADAIPALLCDEDDVQGEHAASAGQVDANKLFYLMSRGFTEKEAKQLIIMASFAPVIELVPIEGLRDRIAEEVEERLTQEL